MLEITQGLEWGQPIHYHDGLWDGCVCIPTFRDGAAGMKRTSGTERGYMPFGPVLLTMTTVTMLLLCVLAIW